MIHTTPQTPLVSFILPYYNLPPSMLCECIESILSLSLRPFEREIIVVDDGSDKSPIEHLQKYEADIIYIRQHNGGLSMARNSGIRMAQGTFLQFVDTDDLLVRSAYEHCLDIIRYGKADMILFDMTETPDTPAAYHDSEPVTGTDFMRQNNLRGTACGYLFRRSVLGELRFAAGIYHEDEEFTPQLVIRAERVCVTDAKAYRYRKRPGSIITSTNVRHRLKRYNDFKAVIIRLAELADTLPTSDRVALQRRVAQLTMDYIYKIIIETRNRHFLDRKLSELSRNGLFPLPDKNYTTKYTWFSRLTNSSMGLSLLMNTLPLMKRER